MDTDDLNRFGELLEAMHQRRALTIAELYEAAGLLGEVTRSTAALADPRPFVPGGSPLRGASW